MNGLSVNTRLNTMPVDFPQTRRNHPLQVLTSMPPGKMVPIGAIEVLREDSLSSSMEINVEMLETKELLMNPVNLRITAYCVPWLAMARFDGSRDQFDRSYNKQPQIDGGVTVNFFENQAYGTFGSNLVYLALGLHAGSGDLVNTMYLEAYNAVWNFRAKNRSLNITPRARLASTLAPAFWPASRFKDVVPNFDQAVIDGKVALNVLNSKMPVSGIAMGDATTYTGNANAGASKQATGTAVTGSNWSLSVGTSAMYVRGDNTTKVPDVFAELQSNGITISLSNIELAKQTQAFARLREKYEGHTDEWITDMLMSGLEIPDQALKQPMLMADQMVQFMQGKRYATDGANLTKSAVSGAATMKLNLNLPKLSVGGVVMIFAEAMPEQLFERQRDPFFFVDDVVDLPDALRDTLDPEKVDVILKGEIDTSHANPGQVFGYGPLNWKWNSFGPRIGGKFARPTVDTTVDASRARLWALETLNPTLTESFYLVQSIHLKPFVDEAAEPFELTIDGNAVLTGNTQFGGALVESTVNYDKVLAKAPTARIVK